MKKYDTDTSGDYDDMVGYIAEENKPAANLGVFMGDTEEVEYKPSVKAKEINPDFPEKWQSLYINFLKEKDYIEFMLSIGLKPMPKLKTVTFTKEKDNGILDFFGDSNV